MVVHQKGQSRSRQKQSQQLQTKSPALRPGKAGDQKQESRSILDQNSAAPTRQPCYSSDRKLFTFLDRVGINT